MGRKVKHIHAKANEYVKVHRNGGSGHGGGGGKGGEDKNWGVLAAWILGICIAGFIVKEIILFVVAYWVFILIGLAICFGVYIWVKKGKKSEAEKENEKTDS